LLIGCLALTACTAQGGHPGAPGIESWLGADLRALDPPEAANPSQDLIAAYARQHGERLEIRLDLLDMAEIPDFDLYLIIDHHPTGRTGLPLDGEARLPWDTLIRLPAAGAIQVVAATETPDGTTQLPGLQIFREPRQDAVSISAHWNYPFNGELPGRIGVEAFITAPGEMKILDRIGPFFLDAPAPRPAQALLTFWNTMPAYTPLQTLRRWDGAHTGPLGGRHGLDNLLRVARASASPLFLLDLNTPPALSALDLVGGMDQVRQMVEEGSLALAETLPGFSQAPARFQPASWALTAFAQQDRQVSRSFRLPSTPLLYAPGGSVVLPQVAQLSAYGNSRVIFLPQDTPDPPGAPAQTVSSVRPAAWEGRVIIPLPVRSRLAAGDPQVDRDGLALAARRELVEAALASQDETLTPSTLAILGGDLGSSAWGNPAAARAALDYIHNHPWIHLLAPAEISALKPVTANNGDRTPRSPSQPPVRPDWLERLRVAPDNNLSAAAWQAYRLAYAPVAPSDPRLANLREFYTGQVGILLEAAGWAANPGDRADCSGDLDEDGQVECLLSSGTAFAVCELDGGGYLAYLFLRSEDGSPHQVIAPSVTLISGTSPPDQWVMRAGQWQDPQAIAGAFMDQTNPTDRRAEWQLLPGELRLFDTFNNQARVFRLLPGGLRAEITTQPAPARQTTFLPLNLDPWWRFTPGWPGKYRSTLIPGGWSWEIVDGARVEVRTNAEISVQAWSEHLDQFCSPEDPNREVASALRLPSPMASAELIPQGDYWVEIRIK
jgi:hypothetical protein